MIIVTEQQLNIPQATAAQGTVSQPMVAAQEDLTSLPPEPQYKDN